jgi:uncharacterized membrane protein (DUF2068 family)
MAKKLASFRAVAVFEAVKGVLVLIAAGALTHFLRSDFQSSIEELVRHFHLNPARHYPRVFVDTVLNFGSAHLIALSAGALAYAMVRFVEAYGLWHGRTWAWGFGILSAALYVPFELVGLTRHLSWSGLVVLAINLGIVMVLWRGRAHAGSA